MTELEAFLERRARAVPEDRAGQERANALEEMHAESVRRHREKLRRENRAAWYVHLCGLADSLRRSADEFDRKAALLLEEDGG